MCDEVAEFLIIPDQMWVCPISIKGAGWVDLENASLVNNEGLGSPHGLLLGAILHALMLFLQ